MTVSEFQNYILKYKKHLAFFMALSILVCAVYINVKQSHTAQIYIKYLGENAEDGKTQNNKDLNPYEISNAYIVKKAMEKIGADVSNYDAVRKNIVIKPVVLSSEEAKYASYVDKFSDYENTEENRAHPVYYSVQFTSDKGDDFARKLLNALVEEYRNYYVEQYAYSNDIAVISEAEVMRYDYFETADILKEKIMNNIEYLDNISAEDVDFRSVETGYSITDLSAEYGNLLETDLASVSKNILENGISKDGKKLKATLNNRAENALLESERNADMASTQYELMNTYSVKNDEYMWDTITPEADEEKQVWNNVERDHSYNRNKSVYDDMILNYVGYSINAKDLLIDKDLYKAYISCFSDGGSENPEVETALIDICSEYNRIQKLTEKTIGEYNSFKAARYVATISGIATYETITEMIYYVATLILSLGLGITTIIFIELKRKKKV